MQMVTISLCMIVKNEERVLGRCLESVQEIADEIIIEEAPGQKFTDIKKYNIDIFTVGSDWVGSFDYLKDYCKVVYLDRTKDISSTMLRQENSHIQRIGIIGTGRIASRFVVESKLVSGVSIQGVYNPHEESMRAFADQWQINGYTDLASFYENVDVVYIATPHETHYAYIKDALLHEKHVICEKPMVLKKEQAEELFALAKEKGLILFEGVKTAYCPGFHKLLGIAASGSIGAIRNIEACFTKLEKPDTRELTDTSYGGSFTELGSYIMLPVLKLLGEAYTNYRFESLRGENGLDAFTKLSFTYPHALATLTCGLGVKSEGRLLISGTRGYIVAEAPWWKTSYFEVHYENASHVQKYSDMYLGDGLRYEISDFLTKLRGNESSNFKLTAEESIFMADMMEKFLMEQGRKIE